MPCCADSKCTACEMSQHGCPERLSNRSKGFQEDGAGQQTMEVLVETLTGTAFEMTVSPTDTVFAIKSKIFRVEGIPVSQQHLVYNLQELDDASSLGERGIGDGARLRLVLGMRGGPVATRRLALPPPSDIDALLDCNREDGEWGSGGWKVTVLVFRDGERVNMVRVRENRDGTYSPLDHNKYGSAPRAAEAGAGARGDNAVTLAKMLELRRRMEGLALARRRLDSADAPSVMHKTRSEESLVGECSRCSWRAACSLPPIAARADSERDVHARPDADRYQAPRWPPARLSPALAPVPADCSWRSGSVWSLGAGAGGGMFSSSTSALESLRVLPSLARAAHCDHLHLSDDGLHLASTTASPSQPPSTPARPPAAARPAPAQAPAQKAPSQAPAEEAPAQAPAAPAPARPRCGQCRKRLSIATLHLCRCGGQYCAPHRYAEVHGCAYDYKADASRSLQRANPRVAAPKLPRI